MAVEDFNAVKILDPLLCAQTDAVTRAAFDAIASSGYSAPVEDFGRKVARALGTPTVAPKP